MYERKCTRFFFYRKEHFFLYENFVLPFLFFILFFILFYFLFYVIFHFIFIYFLFYFLPCLFFGTQFILLLLTKKTLVFSLLPSRVFNQTLMCWVFFGAVCIKQKKLNIFATCFQEPFVQACIVYLKRRCSAFVNNVAPLNDSEIEKIRIILTCLQTCISNLSPNLANEIVQICNQFRILVGSSASKTNTSTIGAVGSAPGSSLSAPGSSLLAVRSTPQPPTPSYASKSNFATPFGSSESSFSALANMASSGQASKVNYCLVSFFKGANFFELKSGLFRFIAVRRDVGVEFA